MHDQTIIGEAPAPCSKAENLHNAIESMSDVTQQLWKLLEDIRTATNVNVAVGPEAGIAIGHEATAKEQKDNSLTSILSEGPQRITMYRTDALEIIQRLREELI